MQVTLNLPPLASYQRDIIFAAERNVIIEATTKAGKAQPLDALVYTPTGPVRMGSLAAGDRVLSPDGPATVRAVYPQGVRPIYAVEFGDGSVVECDGEHLWEVRTADSKRGRLFTTLQLLAKPARWLRRAWVRNQGVSDFECRSVPVDPYLLGVLIGDGSIKHEYLRLSSEDTEIVESIRGRLPRGHTLRKANGCDWTITAGSAAAGLREQGLRLRGLIASLGLIGCGSDSKFIPTIYRYNTVEIRRSILAGIFDTDGFVDKHGQPAIEQTSEKLARDIAEVIQSLGGSVLTNLRKVNGYKDKNGAFVRCRPVWRQSIHLSDASWLFRLSRKLVKLRPKKKTGNRMFVSVRFVRDAQAQCIEIDAPSSLYLTNGFIPTHNTVGCMYWLLSEAFNTGAIGREYWWIAPVSDQAAIAFRRLKNTLRLVDQLKTFWDHNDTGHFITLANGGIIRFKSADKPDSLYGEDVYAAVVDEASRCKDESWHAVRSTITATKGKLRIIGNVRGSLNWAYRLARSVQKGLLPGWKYGKITAYDAVKAGIISASEVEAARRELPERVFKELYEAEVGDGRFSFFKESVIEAHKAAHARDPIHQGSLKVPLHHASEQDAILSRGRLGMLEWHDDERGAWKLWFDVDHGIPTIRGRTDLVLAADVGCGVGASNTCFSVGMADTGEIIAEFASAGDSPEDAARLFVAFAWWIGGKESPRVNCEVNGGQGEQFLQVLHQLNYPNIQRRMKPPTSRSHLSTEDAYGWMSGEKGKVRLLMDYRAALTEDAIHNPSAVALDECLGYYLDEHQRAKTDSVDVDMDPETGAALPHGDRVIANALLWHTMKLVPMSEPVEEAPPVGSLAHREMLIREQEEREEQY